MAQRRQRTGSHVTADIGVKHVEFLAAAAGFTTLIVPMGSDYGYDIPMLTFDEAGKPDNGYVFLQMKSSRTLSRGADGTIPVRVQRKHLQLWLREPMPVILVRYDRSRGQAYWLYVQQYFARQLAFSIDRVGTTLTLRVPVSQVLDVQAMVRFAEFKNRVIMQVMRVIDHA